MKPFYILLVSIFVFSCSSVDVNDTVKTDSGVLIQSGKDKEDISQILYPSVEVIEKPVFVPAAEAPPVKTPPGTASVQESNKAGIIRPQDYSHAAMVYNYNNDFVYEVYTAPLRVTDVSLQPGEIIAEPPFVSDSERWILGAGVHYENGNSVQHVYIKPTESGLSASLIINTDRRVYRIILRSFKETHMPYVRWRYNTGIPENYVLPSRTTTSENNYINNSDNTGFDPRFLSFNYRITYGLFSKPNWFPKLVFDDGSKTFINFPDSVLQKEMPTVFEKRNDILNYRVTGNVIVIDKLIEEITIRIGKKEIIIKKKRS